MSDLTERKFGYMIPPHHHCDDHCCQPTPPHQCAVHGGIGTPDWMQYINSYIDVRARQIYDKLKSNIDPNLIKDEVILKDKVNGKTYKVFMYNGNVCSELYGTDIDTDVEPDDNGHHTGCNCDCSGGSSTPTISGDKVNVIPKLASGTKTTHIADIQVNGKTKSIYAPSKTIVDVEVDDTSEFDAPKFIGKVVVDGEEKNFYCEESRKIIFDTIGPNELGSDAINIGTVTLADNVNEQDELKKVRFYAPVPKVIQVQTSETGNVIAYIETKKLVDKSWNEEQQAWNVVMETVRQPIYAPTSTTQASGQNDIILTSVDGKKYRVFIDETGALNSEPMEG